jgi:hypothetical protein
MKGDSMNFFDGELQYMAEHPNKRAMEIGRREPYYLTYLKKGLPNPKPKEANNGTCIHKSDQG